MKNTGVGLFVLACAFLQLSTSAFAADPVGFYVGGAGGESTVRDDAVVLPVPKVLLPLAGAPNGYGYNFDEHHSAWKVMLGVRPLPVVGAELEYLDLGHPNVTTALENEKLQADAQSKGPALFAVGYLPLPIPLLDLFGKVGVAHLQTSVNAIRGGGPYTCPPGAFCPAFMLFETEYHSSRTDSSVAYGAGAQVKLSSFAIRLEYERVSESYGDPELVSLGVTWRFL
jgi:hypothetical protein